MMEKFHTVDCKFLIKRKKWELAPVVTSRTVHENVELREKLVGSLLVEKLCEF